jgi:hypothetical protein
VSDGESLETMPPIADQLPAVGQLNSSLGAEPVTLSSQRVCPALFEAVQNAESALDVPSVESLDYVRILPRSARGEVHARHVPRCFTG